MPTPDSTPLAFPTDERFSEAFREMFAEMHGFVYAGANLEATIDTVKWLRSNPDRAAFLLGDFDE